uniref:FERM domain-containing protein 8 n=1 Tax=Trichuris muris TaxID=70415 RepID=A0A5S6QZ89_TRIMR
MRTKRAESMRPKPLDLQWFHRNEIAATESTDEQLSPVSEMIVGMTEMSLAAKGDGSLQRRSSEPLELCIFLPDQRGLQFTVAEGRQANAHQFIALVWAELGLEKEMTQRTLALWMCSPLLSIQLKGHHVPFKLRKLWPHLLRRYANASEEQIFQDEPLLMVRRNVMLTTDQEVQFDSEPKLLELLYLDAKDCTLRGYRPFPVSDYTRLAAIQMAIEWGPFDSKIHTLNFIRDAVEDFFPEHVLSSIRGWSLFGWTISGCARAEAAIMEQYEDVSDLPVKELHKRYLQLNRQHPGYGSAVFFGQIEQRGRWRTRNAPVIVTINCFWLTVVDQTSRVPLLTMSIGRTKWCCLEGAQGDDPFLALLFPSDDYDSRLKRMVVIASKQATFMEALLDSMATAQEGRSNGNSGRLDEAYETFFKNRTDLIVSAVFDLRDGVCLEMPDRLRERWLQSADHVREPNDYPLEQCAT